MFYRYPINDVHIHLFDPKDIDECIAMVDECGYTNWTFLAWGLYYFVLLVLEKYGGLGRGWPV